MDAHTDSRYYQAPTGVCRGTITLSVNGNIHFCTIILPGSQIQYKIFVYKDLEKLVLMEHTDLNLLSETPLMRGHLSSRDTFSTHILPLINMIYLVERTPVILGINIDEPK